MKTKNYLIGSAKLRAFTLIELLVAIAIIGIPVVTLFEAIPNKAIAAAGLNAFTGTGVIVP